MESGHGASPRAGAEGASGGGGLLCHACGYQYPNAHPSAKVRRAHRKHCGKPASAAAAEDGAGERDGKELVLGEGGGAGAAAGGDAIGAAAEERGGGSVQEGGNAAAEGDNNADHSSQDGAGAPQVVDSLVSCSGIPSEITAEVNRADNDDTLAEMATGYSGKTSVLQDEVLSEPTPSVSSEQLHGGSVLVLPSEQANAEGSSLEFSVQSSNVVSVEPDTTGDGISEQTNDVVTQSSEAEINIIGKDLSSDENYVKGDEFDFSSQEELQTKIGDRHNTTAVDGDKSDKNLDAVLNEEIPNDATEPNQQGKPMLTSSIEQVPITGEPVKSFTQISVDTDDYSFGAAGCHSAATNIVKPQQQPDSTSVTADNLAISKQAGIVEEEHYPNTDGGNQAISSAIELAIDAKVVSDGAVLDSVCSSDITLGENMQKNVTSGTAMPSQVEPVVLGACTTAFENQQSKEVAALPIAHEAIADSNTEKYLENQQSEDIVAETSSYKISAVQTTTSLEAKEQIEEFIANLASEKINVASSRDVAEEKQAEVNNVNAKDETDAVCSIETIGENTASREINAGAATHNVEDNMDNEEVSINMVCSSINEEKMHTKDFTERIVVHNTDDVKEQVNEETSADPTSHEKLSLVTSIDSVAERKDEETTADLPSHRIDIACTTDSVKEKNGECILDSTSSKISTVGSIGDVEDTKQHKETTAEPISRENNNTPPLPPGSDDAVHNKQNGGTTISLASDKTEVAQVNDVQETEKKEGVAAEIDTIRSTNDLRETDRNEEIADKEMVTDSERSHVSLKVLLADKNVETKKKTSTKDRVLSFRRRGGKDNVSPVKPGSPKSGAEQQDWNSPARLPAEKKLKGKKQQWVPFICCSSIQSIQ